ncbi:hypothetical protein D3C85_1354750 [compost metagenome]
MVHLAPLGQLALIQQQLELVLHTLVATRKPEQHFLTLSQLGFRQFNRRVKDAVVAHRM